MYIAFVNLYSAALISSHSLELPVQEPKRVETILRREKDVGRDPEKNCYMLRVEKETACEAR